MKRREALRWRPKQRPKASRPRSAVHDLFRVLWLDWSRLEDFHVRGWPGETMRRRGRKRWLVFSLLPRGLGTNPTPPAHLSPLTVSTRPMRWTTRMPEAMRPKMVCLPTGVGWSVSARWAGLAARHVLVQLTVKPLRGRQRDEELRAVGVRPTEPGAM